jgi:transcription initiation factor TFIIF subunit beta
MAVKREDSVPIKSEAEDASPMALDDDIYEDAGDLDFYDSSLPQDPFGSMYLARVPQYVWEAWSKLDEKESIEIGTIRQWTELDKTGKQKV